MSSFNRNNHLIHLMVDPLTNLPHLPASDRRGGMRCAFPPYGPPTRPTIEVSPDSRDKLKIQVIALGKTLKDSVIGAPMERSGRNSVAEDKVWGEMSEQAKQEGLLNVEESESLLTRTKNA